MISTTKEGAAIVNPLDNRQFPLFIFYFVNMKLPKSREINFGRSFVWIRLTPFWVLAGFARSAKASLPGRCPGPRKGAALDLPRGASTPWIPALRLILFKIDFPANNHLRTLDTVYGG